MKKIIILSILAALVMSCNNTKAPKEEQTTEPSQEQVTSENLVKAEIAVFGMTCEGCENAIKSNLGDMEGIAEVMASHVDSIAVISYDSTKVNIESIKAKIAETGYETGDSKMLNE